MENNLVAVNSVINFAELVAIVGGGFYLDRRIRRLEGLLSTGLPTGLPKIDIAGSEEKSTIDLEKSIATLSRRLETHEDILSRILLNMEPKNDEETRTEGGTRSVRLNLSPGRTNSILKGRSRIVPTDKESSDDHRSVTDSTLGHDDFKIDLDQYQDLD